MGLVWFLVLLAVLFGLNAVAWSADGPWHGPEDRPTLARLDEVKARTVVTKPRSPLDGLLGAAPGWTRVTPEGSALAAFVRR